MALENYEDLSKRWETEEERLLREKRTPISCKAYGYERVSTRSQHLDRQHEILIGLKIPEEQIFSDKISGVIKERPGLSALKKALKPGDTVIVESLSRLARSTQDLLEQLKEFEENGISFYSVKENIDFSTPTGRLILTVLAAIVTFEREIINQRTLEGIAIARASGKKFGRPKVSEQKLKQALKLKSSCEYTIADITEMTGISRATLYRELSRLKAEKGISCATSDTTDTTDFKPTSIKKGV